MDEFTPSEKVQAKAAVYLLEGRVKIRELALGNMKAEVTPHDGGDPYRVKFSANGWHCDCPARVQVCAHVLACQTVTDMQVDLTMKTHPVFASDPDIDKLLGL